MDYIMVTFKSDTIESEDLRVPVFVKIGELINMLSKTFGIYVGRDSRLQAEPLGRILDNNLTLLEEEVGDGALLTLILHS